MTSNQIAELRKTDPIPGGAELPHGLPRGAPLAIVPYDVLMRLLDEREDLLKALQLADDALTMASDGGRFYYEAIAKMQAAIAKAEGPTPSPRCDPEPTAPRSVP